MCLPGLKVISEFSCKLLFNSNSVVEDLPLLRTTFELNYNLKKIKFKWLFIYFILHITIKKVYYNM